MPLTHPADELAEIRAEIARLRLREAALRAQFLRDPDLGAQGRWTRVEVAEVWSSRLNPALLPETVLNDPRYRDERVVKTVHCVPLRLVASVLRPGWPIQCGRAGLH